MLSPAGADQPAHGDGWHGERGEVDRAQIDGLVRMSASCTAGPLRARLKASTEMGGRLNAPAGGNNTGTGDGGAGGNAGVGGKGGNGGTGGVGSNGGNGQGGPGGVGNSGLAGGANQGQLGGSGGLGGGG